MATVEGIHSQGAKGRQVRYRVDYEVVGTAVNYRATFDAVVAEVSRRAGA